MDCLGKQAQLVYFILPFFKMLSFFFQEFL